MKKCYYIFALSLTILGGILYLIYHSKKTDEKIKVFTSGLTFDVISELKKIGKAREEYCGLRIRELKDDYWTKSTIDVRLKILGFDSDNVRKFFGSHGFELGTDSNGDEFFLKMDGKTLDELKEPLWLSLIVIIFVCLPGLCAWICLIDSL
jgi:hypothetical protein